MGYYDWIPHLVMFFASLGQPALKYIPIDCAGTLSVPEINNQCLTDYQPDRETLDLTLNGQHISGEGITVNKLVVTVKKKSHVKLHDIKVKQLVVTVFGKSHVKLHGIEAQTLSINATEPETLVEVSGTVDNFEYNFGDYTLVVFPNLQCKTKKGTKNGLPIDTTKPWRYRYDAPCDGGILCGCWSWLGFLKNRPPPA
jgi:hypothetical protein